MENFNNKADNIEMADTAGVGAALIHSLKSNPRYIPSWYFYDKHGSELYEKILEQNTYYYFKEAEKEVLEQAVEEAMRTVPAPCTLIEMGSGSSNKTRPIIDILLQRQSVLKYVPVDISTEFLQEACRSLKQDYGDRVETQMKAGEYDEGIATFGNIKGNKIILWLGGFQNQSFTNQRNRLTKFADSMTENDIVLLTVDMTQDARKVEEAYLEHLGLSEAMYRNAFKRLNAEFGSTIQPKDFEMQAKFVGDVHDGLPGRVLIRAKSTKKQDISIPGLGMTLSLEEGEYINLYEGEGYSFKYTQHQLESLATSSGLVLDNIWTDSGNHVALCCFKRRRDKQI